MSMNWKSTDERFGWLPIALHWGMLLLIAAVYALMEFKSITPRKSPGREAMALWHYTLGLTVFALAWLRLFIRGAGREPRIVPTPPRWEEWLARVMHWVLYALLIALPLLGWLTLSAQGATIPFFGAELPALIGKNDTTAKLIKEIHETLATVGYFLIGLHAAAALFHHYVKRDNTLRLMFGGR